MSDQPVVVVTGGGGGIGAALVAELSRQGSYVVALDPMVSLDGSAQVAEGERPTSTAARTEAVSVTDRAAVEGLFAELAEQHGRLDAVVNVAGITRPTSFTRGSDDDWRAVLEVHLEGYLNVLGAALPIMAAAGRGRILGVTSGSGWRRADAGAYSCAKRAVAALTWQLGAVAPPGVSINAISPIAVTRMVTAALGRAGKAKGAATGGLSLDSMPQPEELGPLGARLVADDLEWCRGQVIFAGGPEVAVVSPPKLLEVARTDGVADLPALLESVTKDALVPAETVGATRGGSNPRFSGAAATSLSSSGIGTCAVVSDRPQVRAEIAGSLAARGITCIDDGPADALVLAMAGPPASSAGSAWERALADHGGIVSQVLADADRVRSVVAWDRPVRVVSLIDATTAGGRSRAQAAAQLSRAARIATDDRVLAYAVSVEGDGPIGEIAAHLVASKRADGLEGAELAMGAGWFGLRSHPEPRTSLVLGGSELPPWFDDVLREAIR